MTILEIADELMKAAKGDGRTAVVLALSYAASGGFLRAKPFAASDFPVKEFVEPLDVDAEQSPLG